MSSVKDHHFWVYIDVAMSKVMMSVLVASGFMGVGYFLLNTVSGRNADEIRKVYPSQPDQKNEFARVIFGRGPADLSELKKQTDKRRLELAEKATRYNIPVEESAEKKDK